jgi:hypothetical protein
VILMDVNILLYASGDFARFPELSWRNPLAA